MLPFFSAAFDERLTRYLQAFIPFLGNVDRFVPFQLYCRGLLLAEGRKSIESIATRVAPELGKTRSIHQSLHHFIAEAPWDDEALLAELSRRIAPCMEQHAVIDAWVLDEFCIHKRGSASVGVARQRCRDGRGLRNSQVIVTLSLAHDGAFAPVAHRLYLPQEWSEDPKRRAAAKIPSDVSFESKASIALRKIRRMNALGLPMGIVFSKLPYGNELGFREQLAALSLPYCLAVEEDVAGGAALTCLPGERIVLDESSGEEHLKFFVSTLSLEAAPLLLALMARRRPCFERERAFLEEEIGLAHYEGRGWRGVRHHMTMCLVAYGFVLLERMGTSG